MAAMRSATVGKLPRRSACRVRIEKNAFDPVEPGSRGRGEVQLYPRMPLEPGAHRGVFMGGVVVDHYAQLPKRAGGGDRRRSRSG